MYNKYSMGEHCPPYISNKDQPNDYTVKHGYTEHAYNELMVTAK